jgi:hypothetical protein
VLFPVIPADRHRDLAEAGRGEERAGLLLPWRPLETTDTQLQVPAHSRRELPLDDAAGAAGAAVDPFAVAVSATAGARAASARAVAGIAILRASTDVYHQARW